MNKSKKVWIWPAAILGAAGLSIFIYLRSLKSNPVSQPPGSPSPGSPGNPKPGTGGCSYPLQTGSKNSCVGALQAALGVTQDNSFGPITLAALLAKTGKLQVASDADLQAIISKLTSSSPAPSGNTDFERKSEAQRLQGQYNSDIYNTWKVVSDTTWQGVNWPGNNGNGQSKHMAAGTTASMGQYGFQDITTDGYLILQDIIFSSSWKVDPYSLSAQ